MCVCVCVCVCVFTCLPNNNSKFMWQFYFDEFEVTDVPNSCARSWLRTRNSLPNLRSTWFAFFPATLL